MAMPLEPRGSSRPGGSARARTLGRSEYISARPSREIRSMSPPMLPSEKLRAIQGSNRARTLGRTWGFMAR